MTRISHAPIAGYDAREMWLAPGALLHPAHTIEAFTLRSTSKIFSADTLVWPSLFDLLPELHRPAWIGPFPPLWDDLAALQAIVAGIDRPYAIISIEPLDIPRNDDLLGYDVVDGGLISGLSDCAYTPEERAVLATRFAPHLNEHHLFTAAAPALEFARHADTRVPEHAPFSVVAIRLLARVNA